MNNIADTSIEALNSIREHIPALDRKVYAAIRERPQTRHELVQSTGTKLQSICGCVWRLNNQRLTHDTPQRRETASGRMAHVVAAVV